MLGNYLCFRAPTVWGGFGNSSPAPHPVYLPPSSSTLKSWNLGRETCLSRLPKNGLNPRHPGALHPTRSHLSCSGPLSRGSRASLYPALLCPAPKLGRAVRSSPPPAPPAPTQSWRSCQNRAGYSEPGDSPEPIRSPRLGRPEAKVRSQNISPGPWKWVLPGRGL